MATGFSGQSLSAVPGVLNGRRIRAYTALKTDMINAVTQWVVTKDMFSSDLTLLIFQKSAESRQHINAWVAQQTKQMIQNLLPKDSITFPTRMVLVNAIYFKARWKTEFNAKLTRAAPLYTAAPPGNRLK